jgi:hypothetical protein
LDQSTHVGWARLAWSPSGKRLLFTSVNDVRVLDLATGKWEIEFNLPGGPVAPNALSYPHDDFALLDNRLLVHLPTRIQLCNYLDANSIRTIGGTSFIAVQSGDGGILVPAEFPHPAAQELLEKAQSDPSVFLIHPGVTVAIDVTQVSGNYQQQVFQSLQQAAQQSGYRVAQTGPIVIAAAITGRMS